MNELYINHLRNEENQYIPTKDNAYVIILLLSNKVSLKIIDDSENKEEIG